MDHLDDHDLERYHLGMIRYEAELAPLEEHLLACAECTERAEEDLLNTSMRCAKEQFWAILIRIANRQC